MRALDRKLLRDVRTLWSQALTIALVVGSGLAGFLTSLSAVDSLEAARDRYYADGRFADVFGTVKRAPDALLPRLQALPGVADVQTSIRQIVRVRLPGSTDPVLGQLIGLDRHRAQHLNTVTVVAGRGLNSGGSATGDGEIDALVSKGFAQARGLAPGARVQALVNGRLRTLRVVGWALSPEFIFAGLFGMPDLRGFGVWWVDAQALAAAYDMQGAFNSVSLRLAPASVRTEPEAAVLGRLAALLAPYGGSTPIARSNQVSHAMLKAEIDEQRVIGTVLPAIFLAVAAFLLNVTVSRVVATQREQIAALKALGYGNGRIASHYLQLVLLIVALGLLIGTGLGRWLGVQMLGLYRDVFHFPVLQHRLDPRLLLLGCAATAAAAVVGTLSAILAVVRLTPAEAMRPPAPGHYRRTLVERLGIRGLGTGARMVLRNLERRPWRSLLGVAGVAAAVAIVVMGHFFRDAIEQVIATEFTLKMRSDVSVWMAEAGDADRVAGALARLPGVRQVEPTRTVPATLRNGHLSERVSLRGLPAAPELGRVVDVTGQVVPLPTGGLLLTDRLASKLGLQVGDAVRVEPTEGARRTLMLPVRAVVREMMGLNAYLRLDALNAAMGDGPLANGFGLSVTPGQEDALLAATAELPRVAGAFSKATMLANMEQVTARNLSIISTVLTLFAAVIAVGVVYNNARIALAERAWEMASLRVLGFTRAEVTTLLLGEMAVLVAMALPLGMLAGRGLVGLTVGLLRNDQFDFPVVILPRTYALAALAVVLAAVASAAVVRRRIDRIDMVSALKTRD